MHQHLDPSSELLMGNGFARRSPARGAVDLHERLVDGDHFRAVLGPEAPEALRGRWLQLAEQLDRYAAARDQACREVRGYLLPGQDSCYAELGRLAARLERLHEARAELARLVRAVAPADLHSQSRAVALGTLARQLRGERLRVLLPTPTEEGA